MKRPQFLLNQLLLILGAYSIVFTLHLALLQLPLFVFSVTLIQMAFFVAGLALLAKPFGWWMTSILYWQTLFFLGQSFADTNFWMGLLPYSITVPLLLFIIWGIYR
jgi:hypothetical protein